MILELLKIVGQLKIKMEKVRLIGRKKKRKRIWKEKKNNWKKIENNCKNNPE